MTTAQPIDSISLSAAAVLTGRSTRTWQRRIEDGLADRLSDASGRTLVPFDAVRPALAGQWDKEDLQTLLRADQGDAIAQADMGARFALAALHEKQENSAEKTTIRIAYYFLLKAADQGESDAMHWLGLLNAAGLCEESTHGDAQALIWIAKAAEHGHAIAQQQLNAMLAALSLSGPQR